MNQAEESKDNGCSGKGKRSWQLLKIAIFVVCVTVFLHQSVEFYQHYYTYPTTTTTIVTNPKEFKKPAITFCDRNPMERSVFCAKYSYLCEEPQDLEEFCLKHPYFCMDSNSSVQIPQLGYYTNNSRIDVEAVVNELLLSNFSTSSSFMCHTESEMKSAVVYDKQRGSFGNCESANLHLNDEAKGETASIDLSMHGFYLDKQLFEFKLDVQKNENFYPWDEPKLFFSIHSPFVPSNPLTEGDSLRIGYTYTIDVRLEEQHLLPYPYPTNCVDYEARWEKNNKTGPRSQHLCKEQCKRSFYKHCFNCEKPAFKMRGKLENCATSDFMPCADIREIYVIQTECVENCISNCLKERYFYTVTERKNEPDWELEYSDAIHVEVIVRNPEVIVVSHNPLYGNAELFSYIGGLMGCWLGMSVWAFAGITETGFKKIVLLQQKLENKFRKSSPVRDII